MDFWELTKLLVRRWYFSVPMLVLSVAVALFAGASVKPDYKATLHLQLIPPVSAGTEASKAKNPWNDLGVGAIGNAGIIAVGDKAVLDKLVADGYTDTFTVTLDQRSPIITIEAIGHTPKQATDTAQAVVKIFEQNIASLQRPYGAPPGQLISTSNLDTTANIQTVTSKVKRALAVIGGVGLLLTAAVTIGLDALLRRWAARRQQLEQSVFDAAADVPTGTPQADDEGVTRRIRNSTARRQTSPAAMYRSETAPSEQNDATNAIPHPRDSNGALPAGAVVGGEDATIVLPLPAKEYWGTLGGKGKRS